jgi:hypothetical protein
LYYHHLFPEGCAFDICDRSRLPSTWLDSHGDYFPTTLAAPFIRPLVPSGSVVSASRSRCTTIIFFSEGCALDVSSLVSEGAVPSTMSSYSLPISQSKTRLFAFKLQLCGLPEDPAGCRSLPQT